METFKKIQSLFESNIQLFEKKSDDYGMSWRILRPLSINEQLHIKVKRLRTIQNPEYTPNVDESQYEGFQALFNYSIMAIINLREGYVNSEDGMTKTYIKRLFGQVSSECHQLLKKKNADYGEAWKDLSVESITDLIFQKILRAKQIIGNNYQVKASEGIEGSYMDIANYSIFAMYHLQEKQYSEKAEPAVKEYDGSEKIFKDTKTQRGILSSESFINAIKKHPDYGISTGNKMPLKKVSEIDKEASIKNNYGTTENLSPYFTVKFIDLDEFFKLTNKENQNATK